MTKAKLFVGLGVMAALLGCVSTSKSGRGIQSAEQSVTHIFFEAHQLHVWSYLPITETVGTEKSREGVLNMADAGWVQFTNGPRLQSDGTKLLFNQSVIEVTALNMVVNQTNFAMGAFIPTFR